MECLRWYCAILSSLVLCIADLRTQAMVMPFRRHRNSPHDAIAVVMEARNQSRLRLFLQQPQTLFALLAHPSAGSQNRVLIRGNVTSELWVAIDADYDDNVYYVIDRQARVIKIVDQETSQIFEIVNGISRYAQALARNWLDDVIYWTDAAYDSIFMYKPTGRCRFFQCVSTVVGTDLDNPTGIAVHPHLQLLFWTVVSGEVGKLERSNLRGGDRQLLLSELSRPSAVTIDYSTARVYWLAQVGQSSVVETCNLSGGDRYSAVVLPNGNMADLDILNGLLVMTEPRRGELVLHDISTNVTRRLLAAGSPHGVCVFSRLKQVPDEQTDRTAIYVERDDLKEGFLLMVTVEGSVSMLNKMAVTAQRDITARQIISRNSVTAIAADVTNNLLFFYDRTHRAIERTSLRQLLSFNATNPPDFTIVTRVPGKVAGMAVDWLSGTIYWTDSKHQRVAATSHDGRHVRCLACQDVGQPRAVAIHPIRSLLFWTDVDTGNPRMERINVTSMRRDVLVQCYDRSLALAIDLKDDILYWSEGSLLCRSNLEGRGSEPCTSPTGYTPLAIKSLDVLHDYLLWTDSAEGVSVLHRGDSLASLSSERRVIVTGEYVTDVLYFHPSRQPRYSNPCLTNNGDCQHFCVPTSQTTAQCACAAGYWSGRNGSCFSGFVDDNFILVTDPLLGGIFQQFLYLPNYYVIPVRHAQRPCDVTYDSTTGKIYWSDLATGTISRAFLNGTQQEIVFAHSHIVPEKLHLDDGRQLLYFIDTTMQRVGVISLETMTYMILVHSFQFSFRDITADAVSGNLYLSASHAQQRYVSHDAAAGLYDEGAVLLYDVSRSDLSELITTDGEPRGLVISEHMLYWINGVSGTLNRMSLAGGSTSVLARLPDWITPNDVTILGNYAYLTDSERPAVYRLKVKDADREDSVEERGDSVLFQVNAIASSQTEILSNEARQGQPSLDSCRHSEEGEPPSECASIADEIDSIRQEKGICRVPEAEHGRVITIRTNAYVIHNDVIVVECDPGYGQEGTRNQTFTSTCDNGSWTVQPLCVWAMTYTLRGSPQEGFYLVLTSSTRVVIPRGVTYVDVIAIGAGGGGLHACSSRFANISRAGDGGSSRFGRYLRAGGGRGGTLHSGGRGGFGTVFFGGAGEISSRCLGGGAAGQRSWTRDCMLGSTRCPFCGAGGAPTGCSLCHERGGGCRGPWALPGQGIDADAFGGGGTGWAGGGGGGGGGYSRRFVDVTPGEIIPVTVGRGGNPSAGQSRGGVVVVGWGGRLEEVLPPPDPAAMTCRSFTWTSDVSTVLESDCEGLNVPSSSREP